MPVQRDYTDPRLFSGRALPAFLDDRRARARQAINDFTPEQILNEDEATMVTVIFDRFHFDVPVLHIANAELAESGETRIDVSGEPSRDVPRGSPFFVPGARVVIAVPYEGDHRLFDFKPGVVFGNVPPNANVFENEIRLAYVGETLPPEAVKAAYSADLATINQWLDWIREEVKNYNRDIEEIARSGIRSRRERLRSTQGTVESLGLPIRRKPGEAAIYVLPDLQRKKPIALRPQGSREPGSPPEPELSTALYDDILETLGLMTRVMEESPSAFRGLQEEHIRFHFLVTLNALFEGGATAETFNYQGKTDILIRHEGRVVFVAECKFWKGPRALTDALDQVRGYLTWRNTKAAILMFVRQKSFSKIVAQVVPTVEKHEGHKRTLAIRDETSFRFVVSHRDDEDRDITVTVMLFAVPSEDEAAS